MSFPSNRCQVPPDRGALLSEKKKCKVFHNQIQGDFIPKICIDKNWGDSNNMIGEKRTGVFW